MLERSIRTEVLQVATPLTVGSVTLLSIERVVKLTDSGNTRAWFSIAKQPFALVVRDAHGTRAVDISASAVSLEQLREKIPELDTVLASM